jgi:methionyl aminopeptidase
MVPGNRVGDISNAVQTHVEAAGFSIIRSLVGHGIGETMHEEPQIPNYGMAGRGPEIEEGMVFAIEPMVNVGGPEIFMDDDGWSVYSEDGSMAAHFEFTVAATDNGPRILNPWDET